MQHMPWDCVHEYLNAFGIVSLVLFTVAASATAAVIVCCSRFDFSGWYILIPATIFITFFVLFWVLGIDTNVVDHYPRT